MGHHGSSRRNTGFLLLAVGLGYPSRSREPETHRRRKWTPSVVRHGPLLGCRSRHRTAGSEIAQQEVAGHNLGGPAATRAMSLVAVAINDVTVAAWDSKYAYARSRPEQFDPTIVSTVDTPDSPSYPADHAVTASAAAAVLSYLFPDRKDAMAAMSSEPRKSRLYAGVQFPSDVVPERISAPLWRNRSSRGPKRTARTQCPPGSFPPAPGRWSSATPSFPLAGTLEAWALTSGSQFA